MLEVLPLERMRPVSPNSFVSPESVDRSHFFTVVMSACASRSVKKFSKVTTQGLRDRTSILYLCPKRDSSDENMDSMSPG